MTGAEGPSGEAPKDEAAEDPLAEDGPEAPKQGRVLGIDFGLVRVGLAWGDLESGLVLPLPVLAHPGNDAELAVRLAEVVSEQEITQVVIGLPLYLDGQTSPMSQRVERLRAVLLPLVSVPVLLRDERLTSADAEAKLRDAGLRWWQIPKGQVDALAAMTLARELLFELRPELGLNTSPPASDADPSPPNSPESRARKKRRERRQARSRRKR